MRRADDEHRFRLHHQRSVPSADPATASPCPQVCGFIQQRNEHIRSKHRAERDAEGRLTLPLIGLPENNPSLSGLSPPPSVFFLNFFPARPPSTKGVGYYV